MISIAIYNMKQEVRHATSSTKNKKMYASGEEFAVLSTRTLEYEEGDYIQVKTSKPNTFLWMKLDETLEESLVYFKDVTDFVYKISFGLEKEAMKETAFSGKSILLTVRLATRKEMSEYRNQVRNRHATDQNQGVYPYASTNSGASRQAFMAKKCH